MIMKRPLTAALAILLLPTCAYAAKKPPILKLSANPSALVAEEIALKQAANTKGTAKALRDFAAPGAVMFAPMPASIQAYLKASPAPLQIPDYEVHKIIMSCDGKTGVTTGAWTGKSGDTGYFTNVWQWYERGNDSSNGNGNGNGKWMLVFMHNDKLQAPRAKPDYIAAQTASCKGSAPVFITAPPQGTQSKKGLSRDQSLSWTWQYHPDTTRELEVAIWDGKQMIKTLHDKVAVPFVSNPK